MAAPPFLVIITLCLIHLCIIILFTWGYFPSRHTVHDKASKDKKGDWLDGMEFLIQGKLVPFSSFSAEKDFQFYRAVSRQ